LIISLKLDRMWEDAATGVGTIALAAVTGVVLVRDWTRNRQDAKRDARKVFGLTEGKVELIDPADEGLGHYPEQRVVVVNTSEDPIFEVAARSHDDGVYAVTWEPGVHQGTFPVVMPHDRATMFGRWFDTTNVERKEAQMLYWMFANLRIEVTWLDGRGNYWRRVGYAPPERTNVRSWWRKRMAKRASNRAMKQIAEERAKQAAGQGPHSSG
jgi:hypothetical protein